MSLFTDHNKRTAPEFQEYIGCMCHSPEHALVVHYKDWGHGGKDALDNEFMTIEATLSTDDFWGRLRKGLKYIFGYRQNLFGDVMLDLPRAKRLLYLTARYIDWEEDKAALRANPDTHHDPVFEEQMGA